jgi:hypothetical protein
MEADPPRRGTAQIRTEIEETRAELAETVEAIEQKLRPGAVAARAAEGLKDAAAARVQAFAGSDGGIMGMMRDNPVPTALIAVGAGWLLANARRDRRRESGDTDVDRGTGLQTDPYWREMKTHRRHGMDMTSIRRSGQDAQAHLRRVTSENPLLVGAGALLVGAAFGLAVPETEPENALMGEARDSVVERAQQMASDAAGRLQDEARGVADAAGRAVDSLTPRSQG